MISREKNHCQLQIHAKELDPVADEQVQLIVNHPALHGFFAIMPDAHAGVGCVIGFTGRFRNAVIPNIVGVDIGCGVACHPLAESLLETVEVKDWLTPVYNLKSAGEP